MNVDNLMNRLLKLPSSIGNEYKAISRSDAKAVREEIETWLTLEHDTRLSVMEAKVFAYEAILQNSNFAMAVTREEGGDKE